MKKLVVWGVCAALGMAMLGAQGQVRPTQPRIRPLSEAEWSADVRDGLAAFGADPSTVTIIGRTLAHHPAALKGIGPLARFLRERAMVAAVDQTLLALRIAWLSDAEAVWAERATEALSLGLTEVELSRIAEGPEAGWGSWDAAILQAADELHRDSFLSEDTWDTLASRYDAQQMIEVIFSAGEYTMLSMMANSFGIEPDPRFGGRLPSDVPRRAVGARSMPARLETPRIAPLPREEWTEEVRQLLDPNGTGASPLNLYMTLARHPAFYRPRAVQSAYIRTGATLPDRARELLILRIGWLCGAEYEWAQHVRAARQIGFIDDEIRRIAVGADASGWDPSEAVLIRATDELHRDDTISDVTWLALEERYDTQELIDIVITVAGYRMVSMALNSIGAQLEPNREGFPRGLR